MPYSMNMEIIETKVFEKLVDDLFTEDQYHELQKHLVLNSTAGDVIPGGAGLRKIRWQGSGRGKRGGARVIYYHRTITNRIYLLYGYLKNEQEDLTKSEIKQIAKLIEVL